MELTTLDLIEHARKHLISDPHLAVYMVRDLPETREAQLADLAWAMTKDWPHKNEATYLLDKLEEFVKKKHEV